MSSSEISCNVVISFIGFREIIPYFDMLLLTKLPMYVKCKTRCFFVDGFWLKSPLSPYFPNVCFSELDNMKCSASLFISIGILQDTFGASTFSSWFMLPINGASKFLS